MSSRKLDLRVVSGVSDTGGELASGYDTDPLRGEGERGVKSAMPDPFIDGMPTLGAPRLRLRQLGDADVPALQSIFGDPVHLRYWSHGPLADLEAATDYLNGIQSGWRERTFFQWGIEETGSRQLVGTVTLGSWDRTNRHAGIGFIVHPDRQGLGLATEAVRRVLAFGFGPMGLHRVEADVDPENEASMRLLERIGFQREGLLRDRWFTFFGEWKDSLILGLLAGEVTPP